MNFVLIAVAVKQAQLISFVVSGVPCLDSGCLAHLTIWSLLVFVYHQSRPPCKTPIYIGREELKRLYINSSDTCVCARGQTSEPLVK